MRLFFFVAALAAIIDQLTKFWVVKSLEVGRALPVIEGFFSVTHIENSGVAFGMLGGSDAELKRWLLSAVVAGAMAAVFYYWKSAPKRSLLFTWACALIFGGALGNLIDRVSKGRITDFLEFGYGGWTFPVFNGADTFVSVGVGLFLLHSLLEKEEKDAPGTL